MGTQTEMMKLIPQFMSAGAAQETAAARTREEETRAAELPIKEREVATKEAAETRLREQFERGTPQDRAALYEMNLKNIALLGTTLDGVQVPRDVRQNAYALLRGTQALPGLSALITELAKSGDWDAAGQLVGLPPKSIENTWFGWGKGAKVSPEAAAAAAQPYGLALPGGPAVEFNQEQLQKTLEQMNQSFQQNFLGVLDKLKGQQ
jgi:hypothetical protein